MKLKEKIAEGWLHVHLIFEVLGRPKEHIVEVLNLLIKKLGETKDVEILKSKVHEAKLIESKEEKLQELYSSFAEVEIIVKNIAKLIEIIFDYMPSSIEIISPKDLKLGLSDANALLNDLATRLHYQNMTLNALRAERDILVAKLKELEKK
ncbi:MAG: hypothetical protein QXQ82_01490 [Candidatus Pacearchaeota archaeon]